MTFPHVLPARLAAAATTVATVAALALAAGGAQASPVHKAAARPVSRSAPKKAASAATPASAASAAASAAGAAAEGLATPSGLVYRSLREGTGPSPVATDVVRVNYRGTFLDGREFDSSYSRGQPAEFPLDRVIKCWTEGLQKMKVGGKAMLTCPPQIAYGERGAGNGLIPPDTTLQFEVELLGIKGR